MSRGFIITQAGKKLLVELVITGELNITRVMVGKGELQQGQSPEYFTDLIEPVTQATSSIPVVKNGVISFIVEYRNDLNGGLQQGFWLKEFGVFAQDGENEILLYYASLGEYPQYIDAYENGKVNIKKYPVSILVTDDIKVNIAYAALAFVTEQRMKEFVEIEALPYLEGVLAESESSVFAELDKKADKETVTEELAKKANAQDVEIALNQKADNETIQTELRKKADTEIVQQELAKKANAETMQEELNKKADTEAIQRALDQKANEMEMLTELGKKVDKEDIIQQLAGKANKEEVQIELDKKVDKEEIEEILQQQIDSTNIILELDKKADKEMVVEELAKKANAETMQEELNKKADAEIVSDALALKADSETMQTELDKKADIATMTEELAKKSNTSHTHNYAGSSSTGGVANSATKLNTARTIDGMPFDGSANIVHFGVCETAADVAAKTVAVSGFSYVDGARIMVLFTKGTTLKQSTTLNVNNLGAKNIIGAYNRWPSNIIFEQGNIVELVYYKGLFIIVTANAISLANARSIRVNLASTSSTNFDGSANITPGVTGTLPIANGGTGATSASTALSNLGGFPKSGGAISSNVIIGYSNFAGSSSNKSFAVGFSCAATGFGSFAGGSRSIASYWILKIKSIDIEHKKITFDNTFEHFSNVFQQVAVDKKLFMVGGRYVDDGYTTTITSVNTSEYSVIVNNIDVNSTNYSYAVLDHYINSASYKSFCWGNNTVAIGYSDIAIGYNCITTGNYSYSCGFGNKSSGSMSYSEGQSNIAGGNNSHAEGYYTTASGQASHAANYHTKASANYQTAIGKYNKESTAETDKFIIGNGTSDTARSNCLRVTNTSGVYSNSTFKSSGADYAEMFEWLDGNTDKKERTGLFVTLEKDKIRVATPEDDYILGIVSACPSVCGDVYDDTWANMHLTDIYGQPILEEVEIPERTEEFMTRNEEGEEVKEVIVIEQAHTEIRQKLNTEYDNTKEYIPRSERTEWDAVGILGKLVAIDDGSCEENGWCKVGEGGIATISKQKTRFRVMKRLDQNHIKLLIL